MDFILILSVTQVANMKLCFISSLNDIEPPVALEDGDTFVWTPTRGDFALWDGEGVCFFFFPSLHPSSVERLTLKIVVL